MRHGFTVLLALASALLAGCSDDESIEPTIDFNATTTVPTWSQWGQTAQHQGGAAKAGQGLGHILASAVYDPFAQLEKKDGGGDIALHYQTPLLDGDDVFMEHKSGNFVPCDPAATTPPTAPCGAATWIEETWGEQRFTWESGQLVAKWTVESDWQPERVGKNAYGWEPVFHAALAGQYVLLPAKGGSILVLDRDSGALVKRINPFDTIDANTYVAGPLTVDPHGNVYYNVITLGGSKDPW
jgi:hypothetical protein